MQKIEEFQSLKIGKESLEIEAELLQKVQKAYFPLNEFPLKYQNIF